MSHTRIAMTVLGIIGVSFAAAMMAPKIALTFVMAIALGALAITVAYFRG